MQRDHENIHVGRRRCLNALRWRIKGDDRSLLQRSCAATADISLRLALKAADDRLRLQFALQLTLRLMLSHTASSTHAVQAVRDVCKCCKRTEVAWLIVIVTLYYAEAITAWLGALHQAWLHEAAPCWRALCGTCLLSTVDTTVPLLLRC